MRRVFALLVICAVGFAQAAGYEPCFPPGSCPSFGPPVPLASAAVGGVAGAAAGGTAVGVSAGGSQVVLQSNAVDVETDGGFVISLPSPPPPAPDLPEFSEERAASNPVNRVIAHGRNKIVLLEQKIAEKKKALTEHETWLEQAKRALERVKRQMQDTRLSAKAIKSALSNLNRAEKAERKLTQQARLAKELSETQSKLNILTEQASRVKEARHAIERRRARVSRTIIDHGRQLKWHNDMLKAKIQQFEDDENELAQIGTTPFTISHNNAILEDDEERRNPSIYGHV